MMAPAPPWLRQLSTRGAALGTPGGSGGVKPEFSKTTPCTVANGSVWRCHGNANPHGEERSMGRVSNHESPRCGHPSRRRFAAPQDED
jgi:hypothetical protein